MRLLVLTLMALAAAPASAQLYKWTDAQGKVHYSDRPQDGTSGATAIKAPAAASPAPAAGSQNWQQREADSRERRIMEKEMERKSEAEAAAQKPAPFNPSANRSNKPMTEEEKCTRDRQQIEFAEQTPKLAIGSRALTEAERQEVIRERKANHALACGSDRRR